MAFTEGSFPCHGYRISYDVHGTGDRVLVLVHGLLMNRRMYDTLAPEIASRGNRVVTVDLLGHGRSDRPADRQIYSMTAFADQVLALLTHLELDAPVVGGTSLGANSGWSSPLITPPGPALCSSRCPCWRTPCSAPR